jgi:hypothetical protein
LEKQKIALLSATLFLTILLIAVSLTTYAAYQVNLQLPSTGSIVVTPNLGVYSDSACQHPMSSLNLGSTLLGNFSTYTVYVKNTGGGVSLTLSITASNWQPANADNSIAISWNKEGTKLAPGQSTEAVIKLTVSPDILDITNFEVKITITGTA